MRVAVTGATGFIGRYVLAELEARSLDVIAVVRPTTSLLGFSGARVARLDLNDPPINSYEEIGCPDALIHLAWSGLPQYKSLRHFEQELPAQYRFLKRLVQSGLQTLVVAGTCLEYGMQSGSLSERLRTQPTNPYGFAKDTLRCALEYLQAAHPFNLAWARLFYTYGDGQAENSLWPQLKRAAARGDVIFDMSGGEQLRDYLPVTDIAAYLVSMAVAKSKVGVVNVCSGVPISVRTLVEGWIEQNNWSIKLNLGHYPYPDYEPMAFWGNAEKLFTIIGKMK